MVTAYDYTAARIADAAGIPIILVGDSLGMVVLGYDSTIPVTMDDMVRHTRMVSRGASDALIVADLPFMAYQVDANEAMRNAGRLMQEGGAHTVKMEGGVAIADTVRRIVDAGAPVMVSTLAARALPSIFRGTAAAMRDCRHGLGHGAANSAQNHVYEGAADAKQFTLFERAHAAQGGKADQGHAQAERPNSQYGNRRGREVGEQAHEDADADQ